MRVFGIGIVSLVVILMLGYLLGSKFPAMGQSALGKIGL